MIDGRVSGVVGDVVQKCRDGKSLALATATSQTPDQKRFTISEAAADWYELMIPHMRTVGPAVQHAYIPHHRPSAVSSL